MIKPHMFYTTNAKIQSILGYRALLASRGRSVPTLLLGCSPYDSEREINQHLLGYPNNHNYQIWKGHILPSFKLYERARVVTSLYPKNLKSFLDIGSCKGYYVLETAQNPCCDISTGIDVHEPFISISTKVKEYLDIKNANFYLATLEELSNNPEAYGGPFQTVLLIGTYHYLFWGSSFSSSAFYGHREILTRLSQICTDRVIFSARLEIGMLPRDQKKKAKLKNEVKYNTEYFLEKAEELFDVHKAGYLGKCPLFVMLKRNS